MAAIVDLSYDNGEDGRGLTGSIQKITLVWTSHTDGVAAATTRKVVGSLIKAVTDPSATAPTADYDIVLTDGAGVNILGNCRDDLADRHTSNTEEVYFNVSDLATTDPAGGISPVVCDQITITVTNAGSAKSGTLYLYVRV